MRRDALEQLLREADRLAGAAPPLAGGLADRIRRLAHRRRRRRAIIGGAAAGLAITLTGALILRQAVSTPSGPLVATDNRPSSAEHPLYEMSADARRVLRELAAEDGADRKAMESATAPAAGFAVAFEPVRQQLEQTAYLAVYQGDRYDRELNMPRSARTTYQDTIRLFPNTRAAQVARDRLADLKNEKDHSL